jgi:hypothetical protein
MGVAWSDPAQGWITRRRRCLKEGCGGEVATVERPIGQAVSSGSESIDGLILASLKEIKDSITKRD